MLLHARNLKSFDQYNLFLFAMSSLADNFEVGSVKQEICVQQIQVFKNFIISVT
jgi:hypothetical protein